MVVSVRFLGGIWLDDLSRNYLSSSLDLPLSLCYASYRKRWIKCRLFHFQKGLESLSRDQISCDLAGEAPILNLKSGVYFGLDAVGARIWSLLQKPVMLAEICDALSH